MYTDRPIARVLQVCSPPRLLCFSVWATLKLVVNVVGEL